MSSVLSPTAFSTTTSSCSSVASLTDTAYSTSPAATSSSSSSASTAGSLAEATTAPDSGVCYGPSPAKGLDKAPTVQLLEDLSLRVSRHLFAHRWEHPDLYELVAPIMTAHVEHAEQPYARTREQFIAQYRAATEQFPNYAVDYLSLLADVDLDNGVAVVWGHLRVTGHPSTLSKESVTVMYWKFTQGKWICYRQDGIRGVGNFA